MRFSFRPLCTGTALSVLALALTRCELLVDLDRGEVDGAAPEGCPICSNLTEAGDEEELSDDDDASIGEAGPDAVVDSEMTDGAPDASLTDASGQSAATDAGGG